MSKINFYFNDEKIINDFENISLNSKITFYSNDLTKLYSQFPSKISSLGFDFATFSICIYFADKKVLRNKAYDGWTRDIEINIPTINEEIFSSCKKDLERLVNFLTGDIWTLNFYHTDEKFIYEIKANNDFESIDSISMLSGGLDSYIGAIDLLSLKRNPLFISHYGGGNDTAPYQNKIIENLINHFDIKENKFLKFYAAVSGPIEDSTRSRSLMFFGHAVAISTAFPKINEISVPENGFISLNIPLNESRIGSSSTRTTHPFYFFLFNKILNDLGIRVKLQNYYKFFTKGEMMLQCKDKIFLRSTFNDTVSCSHAGHGRYSKNPIFRKNKTQCGSCLPCLIRKSAIKKFGVKDETIYRLDNNNLSKKEIENTNSYKNFIYKIKNEYINYLFLIKSGPIPDKENLEEYLQMFKRGIMEIEEGLNE